MRRLPVAILILLVGCQGGLLGTREAVSHMQYRTLEKGMRATAVIRAFGKPSDVLEKEGRIRGLSYRCRDARGVVRPLRMVFDDRGRLTKWALQ